MKVKTINFSKSESQSPVSRLREVREGMGLSRRHVAEQLGVTIAAVQDYERSEAAGKITLKTLRKYAGVLGCEVSIAITPVEGVTVTPRPSRNPIARPQRRQSPPAPVEPVTAEEPSSLQDRMGLWSAS